ncbi:MAG TPA: hypothetical protein VMP11_10620 [Verrucomicrobiae bacterium]|nr:hypothetical protein [Verrucomicrobiae bacterium]
MRTRPETRPTPKHTYILMAVTGGGEARQAEYAVLTLDANVIDLLLKRCALSSAVKTLDESFGHLSFHGDWCDWLGWSETLDELLGGKELVVLDRRPRGKPVVMDSCYVEVWGDGDIFFTGHEKHAEGQPVWEACLPKQVLEDAKQRFAASSGR